MGYFETYEWNWLFEEEKNYCLAIQSKFGAFTFVKCIKMQLWRACVVFVPNERAYIKGAYAQSIVRLNIAPNNY